MPFITPITDHHQRHNPFLNIDTHAMIEAPIRVYVTENADGTATLSYKLPSAIYAPYSSDLTPVATELDATFAAIAAQAAN